MEASLMRHSSTSAYPTISLSVLLLAAWLPTTTLAQEQPTTLLASSISPSATATATSASSISPSSTTDASTSPTPSPTPNTNHVFNNYWSFVIVVIVLLILSVSLYTLRRRKLRMLASQQYRARGFSESHDVGGIRSPRYGIGWGWPADGDRTTPPPGVAARGRRNRRGQQVEGLNERGEAPPPYSGVGSKPPSLRSDDGYSGRCPSRAESARSVNRRRSEDVEMGDMTRPTYEPYLPPRSGWTRPTSSHPNGMPPAYDGGQSSSNPNEGPSTASEMTTIPRPEPAVTRP